MNPFRLKLSKNRDREFGLQTFFLKWRHQDVSAINFPLKYLFEQQKTFYHTFFNN